MEDVRRNNTENLDGRLWIHNQPLQRRHIKSNVVFCHPCQYADELLLLGIDSELASFLIESNRWDTIENYGFPEVQKLVNGHQPSSPVDIIPLGTTADVKFVTTAGVYLPRTSYQVYFSPFDFTVWLFFLTSICLSALVLTLVSVQMYRLQSWELPRHMFVGFIVWSLLTTIGQYKHANIPIIRSHIRGGSGGVCIIVVAWFVTSTFLVNVYSAIFCSDATRTFRYKTNYSRFLDLPIMKIYALADQQLVEQFLDLYPDESCILNTHRIEKFCVLNTMSLAQCSLMDGISYLQSNLFESYFQLESARTDDVEGLNDYRRYSQIDDKLKHVRDNLTFVCDSAEIVSQMLEEQTEPVVFLIHDHDFQKYWDLFQKIMELNPKIKVASNFEDQESFLVHPIAYSFTSGLDPAYQGSVLRKMKMLMSSGVYGLWEKWHRIKFTAGGLRHDQIELRSSDNVQPLSFDNSGTSLLFMAQLYAWCVGVCAFVAEILLKRRQCRSAIIY